MISNLIKFLLNLKLIYLINIYIKNNSKNRQLYKLSQMRYILCLYMLFYQSKIF